VADRRLIEALCQPEAYPVPVGPIRLLETHISWVILTGRQAYKIKKPVDFGFLDFTRLADRLHFCQEELRLNRRLADTLYLDCVAITGSPDCPHMEGEGVAIEYAVKMRQFDDGCLFDTLARNGQLSLAVVERLADRLAIFHRNLPPADPGVDYGSPALIRAAALDNFRVLADSDLEPADRATLAVLSDWTQTTWQQLADFFLARKQHGYIRECHGDLHLGNLVLLEGEPVPFDAVEFNPAFRWVDPLSELAFLLMDLAVHGLASHAVHCLNRYLGMSGDMAGLQGLVFYQVYRAMIRAKIIQLGRDPARETPAQRTHRLARYRGYVAYALTLTQPAAPRLFLTHGFSGSGKSTLAVRLADQTGAILLRSDVERKRLPACLPSPAARYHPAVIRQTYCRLLELTRHLLTWGFSVVVDATFLARLERQQQQQLAEALGVDWVIFSCSAPPERLRQRVCERKQAGRDASDATLAVLEWQMGNHDPLTGEERDRTVSIDTTTPTTLEAGLKNGLVKYGQPDIQYAN